MNTYYKNNLKQAFLILESEEEVLLDDYQVIMLQENQIPGILKTSVRYVDDVCQYHYEISGKYSFRMQHEKSNLSYQDMKNLIASLLQTLKYLQKYMITENKILLEPDYIFCEREEYYFCYYPLCKEELQESFHRLTEFFVREVNYKDEEGVRLAYMLHKATMESNYSLEQILAKFDKEEEEVREVNYAEQMERPNTSEILISEKTAVWEPIRRFLEKRKKTCQ